jgi:hypothetical protein
MLSAWNSAREVTWRTIEENLCTMLADWNKPMNQSPWLFRDQALMIEAYAGFTNPLSIKMDMLRFGHIFISY